MSRDTPVGKVVEEAVISRDQSHFDVFKVRVHLRYPYSVRYAALQGEHKQWEVLRSGRPSFFIQQSRPTRTVLLIVWSILTRRDVSNRPSYTCRTFLLHLFLPSDLYQSHGQRK